MWPVVSPPPGALRTLVCVHSSSAQATIESSVTSVM